jgi:thioredoxin 1
LPDGLKIASETRKPVIVDFYAPWCVACRLTDQRIYSREDVVKTSWALVPVKIDVDEKPGIASKYGVRELPTVLFLNSEGKEISRVSGLLPAEGMIQRMEQAVTAEASAF